jgi:hypothetical protein
LDNVNVEVADQFVVAFEDVIGEGLDPGYAILSTKLLYLVKGQGLFKDGISCLQVLVD